MTRQTEAIAHSIYLETVSRYTAGRANLAAVEQARAEFYRAREAAGAR